MTATRKPGERGHRTAGRRRSAEVDAAKFGLPRNINPHAALVEELTRTFGLIRWWELRTVEDEAAGRLERTTLDGPVASFAAQQLDRERRHGVAVAVACVRAGVAERSIRLAEEQGAILASVIRAIVAGLGDLLGTGDLLGRRDVLDLIRRELSAVDTTSQEAAP